MHKPQLPSAARNLAADLARSVRGEVRFDPGSRALYATDASNYRQVPIGVVVPQDAEDVMAAIECCRTHDAPVLARGAGTSLAGQCCNVAVVLDFSKSMNRILEIDPERRTARVQPGVVLDTLRSAAERHRLTFGPDPATHSHCTLGGMIGNNSCGVHSIMSGKTAENVEALEVLTYDGLRLRAAATSEPELEAIARSDGRRGEIYSGLRELRDRYATLVRERFPPIARRVSGYNLDELLPEKGFHVARALVGSEGTCAVVLEATLRLVHSPPGRVLLVLGYEDVFVAADHVPELLETGPIGLEGFDQRLTEQQRKKRMHPQAIAKLPPGRGWLMAEFGGDTLADAQELARQAMQRLGRRPGAPEMVVFSDPDDQKRIWEVRESALGSTARVPGEDDTWEGWEDAAVAPEKLGTYLRSLKKLVTSYGYDCALYGHFGHGCVHNRINFDLKSAGGIGRFRAFIEEAADLVLGLGGSISGEHGDGQARGELLPKMFGAELMDAFRQFKRLWDPQGRMNPGKLVDARPLDADLRLGAAYRPLQLQTEFHYPHDEGAFSRAVERCVGVGKCRKLDGGTMCPSYRVTLEEKHSTRGRANLLFEMLQGELVPERWRSEAVREALDLCLSCKGCKADCPVNVDMAAYKAEFLAHHYRGRLRPMAAYVMGLVDVWARLGSRVPRLANLLMQSRALGALARRIAGIAPERKLPAFAPRTFRAWFAERAPRNEGASSVLLWPDTFTNHFQPEIPQAAVEVLERAGFHVILPSEPLCCGRPLYDFGMLSRARRLLRQTLRVLRPQIEAGMPLVGLEPSCVAVFRDEMHALFPHDEDARRLRAQAFTFGEFLLREAKGFQIPRLERRALVHGHCHHKASLGFESEKLLLEQMGLEYEALDSGCCGMAGSFGFKREHYALSLQIGERVLLPAVRAAASGTLVLSDGFSCREQIAQATGRRALHLAEALRLALQQEATEDARAVPTPAARADDGQHRPDR
jgi:FAD/FMN-containing dehydrogenase/Fe-S oxidoreductase